MDRIDLEMTANEFFMEALAKNKAGEKEVSLKYFCFAHAINSDLGRGEYVVLCRNFIGLLCSSKYEAQERIDYAHKLYDSLMKLPELIKRVLNEDA